MQIETKLPSGQTGIEKVKAAALNHLRNHFKADFGVLEQVLPYVFRHLGYGRLEKHYRRAIQNTLQTQGMKCTSEEETLVKLDDSPVGLGYTDLRVWMRHAGQMVQAVVELKVVKRLEEEHIAQLVGYLNNLKLGLGFLVNFSKPPKKKARGEFATLECTILIRNSILKVWDLQTAAPDDSFVTIECPMTCTLASCNVWL